MRSIRHHRQLARTFEEAWLDMDLPGVGINLGIVDEVLVGSIVRSTDVLRVLLVLRGLVFQPAHPNLLTRGLHKLLKLSTIDVLRVLRSQGTSGCVRIGGSLYRAHGAGLDDTLDRLLGKLRLHLGRGSTFDVRAAGDNLVDRMLRGVDQKPNG